MVVPATALRHGHALHGAAGWVGPAAASADWPPARLLAQRPTRLPDGPPLPAPACLQAIWDEQSALQKAVQQLCGAVAAGDGAAVAAAADAQPRLLQEGVFDVQSGGGCHLTRLRFPRVLVRFQGSGALAAAAIERYE